MTSLRPASVCDTTPLQRFESQSSSGEEPSSPTAASIVALAAAASSSQHKHEHQHQHLRHQEQQHNNNNHINNNVKVDLQLPPFVGVAAGGLGGPKENGAHVAKTRGRGTSYILRRLAMDLGLLSCAGLSMIALSLWCQPYKRGFFCSDLSLKHPYKDSTVPSAVLTLICTALPISMILLVEFYRAQFKPKYTPGQYHNQQTNTAYYLCHMELPQWVVESYRSIGAFAIGLGAEQLTTEIGKFVIGRLRPHFFAVCQPTMPDGTTCDDAINAERYIEDFTCSGDASNPKRLKNVQLSFPSGHASFAVFSMVYLVIYLQRRMHWSRLRMLRHLLQFLMLMFAWFTALTRVSDYKHHSTDVLAGGAIGLLYALVVTSSIW